MTGKYTHHISLFQHRSEHSAIDVSRTFSFESDTGKSSFPLIERLSIFYKGNMKKSQSGYWFSPVLGFVPITLVPIPSNLVIINPGISPYLAQQRIGM